MLVVNLFGAPGSGKSTLALLIGGLLKTKHPSICTEVPDEVAKLAVYDDSKKALRCQLYIAGKQFWQIARCEGHADVVVCDSPILLSPVYGNEYGQTIPEEFTAVCSHYHHAHPSLNYMVTRSHVYDQRARVQNEVESSHIERKIRTILSVCGVKTSETTSALSNAERIVNDVAKKVTTNVQTG